MPHSPTPTVPAGDWLGNAVARIEADYQRSADTHLIALPLPGFTARGIDFYLKDESRSGDTALTGAGSCIEGIGRPRVEASFIRSVIDRMIEVADVDSIAAMQALSALLGRKVGPSTGTNFVGMLALAQEMLAAGEQGSILSLLCDSGERYLPTYYNADWVSEKMGDCTPGLQRIARLMQAAAA